MKTSGRKPTYAFAAAAAALWMSAHALPAGENRWTSHGPATSITGLALDPTNSNVLYAAGDSGIFRSEDGGVTWVPLGGNDAAVTNLTCVAVDPTDSTAIYAGTSQGAVVRSSDGGQTWSSASVAKNPLSAVAVDPTTTVFAATRPVGEIGLLHYDTPISRSADRGATWTAASVDTPRGIYALLADSIRQELFAGSDFAYSAGYYPVSGDYPNGGGVEESTYAGSSWTFPNLDLGNTVTALASDPATGSVLAATSYGDVFRSPDGVGWIRLGSVPGSVAAIAVDPSATSTIYAGLTNGGVWRSGDEGASWREFDNGLTTASVSSLAIDPIARRLHVGTRDAGVFERDLPGPLAGSCEALPDHLCLIGSRFRVDVAATGPSGQTSIVPRAVALADRSGYFSFPTLTGDPALPEVFVKMIDATPLPGEGYWFFYGSLTNVAYTVTVTDTATGGMQVYDGDSFCGSADIHAFPPGPPSAAAAAELGKSPLESPSGGSLSLLSSRFRIVLSATDPGSGKTAPGVAISLGDRFGYFSLPGLTGDATLPEVFVKMLDATSLPDGDFWLFHGSLTGLHYTLTVTDSETGAVKTYRNAVDATRLCGGVDTRVTAAETAFSLEGPWSGTATLSSGVCTAPMTAIVTRSGDDIHISLDSTCSGNLRFDGRLKGEALDGVFRSAVYCPLEAHAAGTASASGIHLVSPTLEGTCGAWYDAKIDLLPSFLTGSWVGTFTSADPIDCEGDATTAIATLQQTGESVTGTLDSHQNDCGFANVTFQGILSGNKLTGTITGDRFSQGSTATGTLSGTTLDITVTNGFGLIPGGQMHLQRSNGS